MVTFLFANEIITLLSILGHPSPHSWSPFSVLMITLLSTHGHPSLHSWSPFSPLMVTLHCLHGHPTLHPWSPFSAFMVFSALMITLHHCGHPSLHSWSPFFALMDTHLCTHGHPSSLWSPFSPLMVTSTFMVSLRCTHGHPSLTLGHPSLYSWSPFSVLMLILLCTIDQPSLHSRSLTVCMATHLYVNDSEYWDVIANKFQTHTVMHILINVIVSTLLFDNWGCIVLITGYIVM